MKFAVNYLELVKEAEKNTRKMFEQLGIPYDSKVLRAFDSVYVPNQKGWKQDKKLYEEKIQKNFSRQDEWEKLNFSLVKKEDIEVIEQLCAKFGYSLNLLEKKLKNARNTIKRNKRKKVKQKKRWLNIQNV